MKRIILTLVFLCVGMVSAQESPLFYEAALERIEEAERTGSDSLNLSGLYLEEVPPQVWELEQLTFLRLDRNRLSNIPADIAKLSNLQILYLDGNNLDSIPAEIGSLSELIWLHLGSNNLSDLPAEIANLTKLEALTIGHNQFEYLPSEIGQLSNLTVLGISFNQISVLPSELGNLHELCQFHAIFNHIREIPTSFAALEMMATNGCTFDVSNNPLVWPPEDVMAQGNAAMLAYLRNEAWFYMQKLIVSGLAMLGLVTLSVLGLRWRNRRGKQKRKNDL